MTLLRFALLVVLLAAPYHFAHAGDRPVDFAGAKWIWHSGEPGESLARLAAGAGFFRADVAIPESPALKSAEIIITCDNLFVLYLNGRAVGESQVDNSAWQKPKRFDVTDRLVPGRSVLAVEAVNTLPGPAGLIVKFVAQLADGRQIVLASDPDWKCHAQEVSNWQQPDFDDQKWQAARVVGQFGDQPWGSVAAGSSAEPAGAPVGKVRAAMRRGFQQATAGAKTGNVVQQPPPEDFAWPRAIVFVGDDCSLYRPPSKNGTARDSLTVTIFNPRKARTFPEHDLPAPMKVGRKLYLLQPAQPGVQPRLLLDAGRGGLGSPSVSFDGQSIFVSMAREDDSFFHIYRLPAGGGAPQQLTGGPFHDIDPAELPDGRIVFTSTRIGTFEEYHNPPSRSLFVMQADGSHVRPLTNTIIFDNEPEVLADGRILFIRSDNFFDRGKVETRLHAIHPDGAIGYTEFGLDNGPEYGNRLRPYSYGSPAPMPDGRVAFLTGPGITVGRLGCRSADLKHFSLEAGDVAALPDGRLICTTARRASVTETQGKRQRTRADLSYEKIGVLDPHSQPPTLTSVYDSAGMPLHSAVYLGPRPRPPVLVENSGTTNFEEAPKTGVLFCQNARVTKQTTAGWSHVRAIRVLAGTGLTTRSSHSYIVHAGNETVELGTVPLAPDGSFCIEVPADTPIALQAVDAEGRSELNEMSWIYVRPGERRGCVGCHQPRQSTPKHAEPLPLAMKTPPLKLLGQRRPHRFRGNNAAVTGLMELQLDRYREVAGINRFCCGDAIDTSAAAPSEAVVKPDAGFSDVAALVAQLQSDNDGLRISAAQRLAIFRDPAAAPALAQCLKDDRREVRVAAAMALATCGTRESVPPLFVALSDRDPLVAQAAAVALENLTGHVQPFDAFGLPAERFRQARAWRRWFGDTTWAAVEQTLVDRLASGDRDVIRRAAVALGHTGGEAARVALREYVAGERGNNPFPEWRKRHRGDGARFNSLAAVNPRTLQAATRALGYLGDAQSVPMLAQTLRLHRDPETANLFLAEAAIEALGRIGTAQAQAALVEAFAGFPDYPDYTLWYGDHPALMACHASPEHYFVIEALDRLNSTAAGEILPHLIRSLPIDPDRALLLGNDDYETLVGRVLRRHGVQVEVVETCLAILGDPDAKPTPRFDAAIRSIHRCWAGHPGPENRAAQVLSLVCRDRQYEPPIRAALERFRAAPTDIPRVFDKGIPIVQKLPVKHWVCFYLARTLGNLSDRRSAEALIVALGQSEAEAASGRPDPLGPGVLFLHNGLTPCWRAAVAWALGRIGDPRATDLLLDVAGNLDNATDTRHAAAEALGAIADPTSAAAIRQLAADYPEISTRRALLRAWAKCDPSVHTTTASLQE